MVVREEIMTLFSDSEVDSVYRIESLPDDFPAYVVRFANCYGVAVPYDGEEVKEDFANAGIHTGFLALESGKRKHLMLTSTVEHTRNEFAVFCEDFVDPGVSGEKRGALTRDPVEWWRNWRKLIGNAITEKKTYAVLGELLVFKYLVSIGYEVEWCGPKSSSHDIVGKKEEFEVKSTTSRYSKTVQISGQFQLQTERELSLVFCRFEPNVNGICINDVVNMLVSQLGIDCDELNSKLSMLGYGIGTSARNEKYQLHEAILYKVDDTFPLITPESFVGGVIPSGIEKIEYSVNLAILEGEALQIK